MKTSSAIIIAIEIIIISILIFIHIMLDVQSRPTYIDENQLTNETISEPMVNSDEWLKDRNIISNDATY
jgi:hypothetical protein